ncbi:HigA family addiction module antitoxin [Thiomicrorhabdus sp. 6S3-12]|uniref:HigA family addiction module antitoxin n=1 Tax=Thiomicrorhabdus sp. 6S3-12 TaxID=2819681 RepID=UPI001AAC8B36|nr:HigA family addiction module antitoxin [Thiomicrorhabdus sp. 6S3-12]MBO1923581.1 HigA family addiction module antidote protein [Thiomicrorhabdus sp. 6S3-12]
MLMFEPPHPGEFIAETYLEPLNLTTRALARHLNVSASTLNRIIKGQSGISPEMALRLSKVLGRTPESWLNLQDQYDLWNARQKVDLESLQAVAM